MNLALLNVPVEVTRKYRFTVPDASLRSAVGSLPSDTAVKVIRSDQLELFAECCSLIVGAPLLISISCRYAAMPLALEALSSLEELLPALE